MPTSPADSSPMGFAGVAFVTEAEKMEPMRAAVESLRLRCGDLESPLVDAGDATG